MVREMAIWCVAVAWFGAIAIGFWVWERYDTTPGATGKPTVAAGEARDHWQLTFFAHPHCPCTRAGLGELAEITRSAPTLSVRVLFVRPPEARLGWEHGDSWDAATQLPGAKVTCDEGGGEARRLGAETSGFAVLANPDGHVVFRGGLTLARGRVGESAGRRAVLAWLNSGNGNPSAPVFGCPLFTHD